MKKILAAIMLVGSTIVCVGQIVGPIISGGGGSISATNTPTFGQNLINDGAGHSYWGAASVNSTNAQVAQYSLYTATPTNNTLSNSVSGPIKGNVIGGTNVFSLSIKTDTYGTVGNGSADDTTALQAALNTAADNSSQPVHVSIPAGTYKITSPLVLPPASFPASHVGIGAGSGVTIEGVGAGKTIFVYSGGMSPLILSNGGSYSQVTIKGIGFAGPVDNAGKVGLWIGTSNACYNGERIVVKDCAMYGWDTGIKLMGLWGVTIDNCIVTSNRLEGIFSMGTHDLHVKDCKVNGTATVPLGIGIGFHNPTQCPGDTALIENTLITYATNGIVNNENLRLTVVAIHEEAIGAGFSGSDANFIGGYISDTAGVLSFMSNTGLLETTTGKLTIVGTELEPAGSRVGFNVTGTSYSAPQWVGPTKLEGRYNRTNVVFVGSTSITNLSDITITSMQPGDYLGWDGFKFTNGPPAAGGGGSQTPWSSDINGAFHSLSGAAVLSSSNSVATNLLFTSANGSFSGTSPSNSTLLVSSKTGTPGGRSLFISSDKFGYAYSGWFFNATAATNGSADLLLELGTVISADTWMDTVFRNHDDGLGTFLGLGTNWPQAKLDVNGTMIVRSNATFLNGATLWDTGNGVVLGTNIDGSQLKWKDGTLTSVGGNGISSGTNLWLYSSLAVTNPMGAGGDNVVIGSNGTVTATQTITAKNFTGNGAGVTNLYGTNVLGRSYHVTNVTANVSVPDASKQYQDIILTTGTNVAGFANLVTGIKAVFSVCYSNSTGGTIVITNPPTSFPIGGVTTNQVNLLAGKQCYWSFDIIPGVRTNYCNAQ